MKRTIIHIKVTWFFSNNGIPILYGIRIMSCLEIILRSSGAPFCISTSSWYLNSLGLDNTLKNPYAYLFGLSRSTSDSK